ncbi:MAG: ABC transporter ATP-binding protein [Frankiaceae bacterium]
MTDTPDEVLRLAGVTVERDGATLLRDIYWRVRAGQRWVVVGANGAGKTTLLQVAAGSLVPTSGSATVLGEPLDATDLDELQTRVGWASAALADRLPPGERVLDVVVTAAHAAVTRAAVPGGLALDSYDSYDEQRALELLAQLGCRALAGRRFGTLSEGERKRVQIARSLMTDPELLLLDEPAAGLDLGAREALLRRLTRLARDPGAPTTVLVTHHVEEVPAGFTHALLLRRGQVVAAGELAGVLTGPLLSATFGLPLLVEARDGRYAARLPPA